MILYYSGTGNSEYAAKRIGGEIGDEVLNLFEKLRDGDGFRNAFGKTMGDRDACLCLENSAHPAGVDEKNEAHGQYRCVFCADLRRRNRKCGKISEGIVLQRWEWSTGAVWRW